MAGQNIMIDLRPHFRHLHWRPMPHSFGVDVASDWADKADDDPVFGLYKRCGLWTMDEAQILHECAGAFPGRWLDIGSHTFWTTAHIVAAGQIEVTAIDPMLRVREFLDRCWTNIDDIPGARRIEAFTECEYGTSEEYFAHFIDDAEFSGFCVDGDHSEGKPLEDAINAVKHLAERGVILFHDATGRPVQEAVEYCVGQGFQCKAYVTVHGVVVCWRGEFTPPAYKVDGRCVPVLDRLGELRRFV